MVARARRRWSRHRGYRTVRVVTCAFSLLLALTATGLAQRRLPEADIRAAFILKFPAFVTWSRALGDTLHIGVADGEELLAALSRLAEQHNATPAEALLPGIPPVVRVIALGHSRDLGLFHILVLAGAETSGVDGLVTRAHQAGVITIDSRPEPGAGTVIRLCRDANRIIFDVDLEAARAAGVKVSSRLLQLAHGQQGLMLVPAGRAHLC